MLTYHSIHPKSRNPVEISSRLKVRRIRVKPDIIKVDMTPSSTGMVHQPNHSASSIEL